MYKCLPSLAFNAYEKLFLVCESYEMAMAVSVIVGMAGCLSRIEPHEISDAAKTYLVRMAPVSHESSFNYLLLSLYSKEIDSPTMSSQTLPLSNRPLLRLVLK